MSGQQAQLPEWIVWVQALAVPLLAMLAAWIGYQQWRTADRKVQLDLFDRRFAVYDEVRKALYPIAREGKATMDDLTVYMNALDKVEFLFGKEVALRFYELRKHISDLIMYSNNMSSGPPFERDDINGKAESYSYLMKFFKVMPEILEPYMLLDHKIGRPFGWVVPLRIRIGVIMERVLKYLKGRIGALKALRGATRQ